MPTGIIVPHFKGNFIIKKLFHMMQKPATKDRNGIGKEARELFFIHPLSTKVRIENAAC